MRIDDYDAMAFTAFMNHYLMEHPEVVEDQQRGWDIYWHPRLGQGRDGETDGPKSRSAGTTSFSHVSGEPASRPAANSHIPSP